MTEEEFTEFSRREEEKWLLRRAKQEKRTAQILSRVHLSVSGDGDGICGTVSYDFKKENP